MEEKNKKKLNQNKKLLDKNKTTLGGRRKDKEQKKKKIKLQVWNAGNSAGLSTVVTGREPVGGITPENAKPHASLFYVVGL